MGQREVQVLDIFREDGNPFIIQVQSIQGQLQDLRKVKYWGIEHFCYLPVVT